MIESLALVLQQGGDTLEVVYFVCFFLGLGFAMLSALLSGVFGGADAGADAGGDMGGHAGDIAHFSPMSPVVLATFISTFGGAGIIFRKMDWPVAAQLGGAFVSAFVVAAGVFALFYALVKSAQHSREARVSDLVGIEAQIITRIPIDGVGEIAYTEAGSRYTAPARSNDGKEIGPQSVVRIVKIVGNTFYVERVT